MTTITGLKERLQTAETHAEIAGLRANLGWLYADHGRWAKAGRQFQLAADAATAEIAAGRPDTEIVAAAAGLRHAQGTMWQLVPQRRPQAVAALEQALKLYAYTDDDQAVAQVQQALAEMAPDEAAAGRALTAALVAAQAADDMPLQIDLHRQTATVHLMSDDADAAVAALETAVALARRIGDEKQAIQLEMTAAHIKADAADETPSGPPDLSRFVQQAQALGDADLLGEARLTQAVAALQEEDFDTAAALAEAARQNALDTPPGEGFSRYVNYASACALLAVCREKRGDDVGVIAILQTARGTLKRAGWRPLADSFRGLLDGLPVRWGDERFTAALHAYREQAAT